MFVKRKIITVLASIALAAGGVLAAGASPAAAYSCQTWFDENTYGGYCDGILNSYRVHAICGDGTRKNSLWVSSGHWTYAYCSGHKGFSYGAFDYA